LLAVPYAFHAGTATTLSGSVTNNKLWLTQKPDGVPSQNWSLFGNSKSDPEKDKLGTTDATDFVFITNNEERLRITADGEIKTKGGKFTIGGNLEVQGDSTRINNDLYVGRNVVLNFDDSFDPKGETINYGKFTGIDDGTFEDDLTVKDTLFAEKIVTKRFNIKDDVVDGEFLATFENTNNDKGDGIKIKLGRKATKNNALAQSAEKAVSLFIGEVDDTKLAIIKNSFTGQIGKIDIPGLVTMGTPTAKELLTLASTACTMAVGLGNVIIDFLNDSFGLPIDIGDAIVPINGCDPRLPKGEPNSCANDKADNTIFVDDDWIIDGTFEIFPAFPQIPQSVCTDIFGPSFDFPTLQLSDVYTQDPLTKQNVFIDFVDNDDFSLGAIKAESITNWSQRYFDQIKIYEIISTLKTLDKIKVLNAVKAEALTIAKSYRNIGVEYASGNGDYAEWLERLDSKEVISTGDIVAVKGGKITKDLSNAEQVMAVSHHPIVLGNKPVAGKTYLGNNIAFMGQIPVKVMGSVNKGDYIVGKGDILGFGIAISPEDMTLEDFKYAVGRSWGDNQESGPKMVNTVVGVHNGDYLNILKRYEAKFKESEARLETVEAKIDMLSGLISKPNIN
jgi:hypothetical protein